MQSPAVGATGAVVEF